MKKISVLALLICVAAALNAKVVLPNVIGDNMVLQQKSDVALWGNAAPGVKVVVTPSWTKEKSTVKAGEDGKWFLRVRTPEAGGPYEITFSDGEKLTVHNVLIGEVWICSGQSNMAMRMRGSGAQPVNGSADIILGAKRETPIRTCNIKNAVSLTPESDCGAAWKENTPQDVADASAVAYFFAKYIHDILGVPVGVINTSWGGTPIEAWMSKEVLEKEFPGEFKMTIYENNQLPEKKAQYYPGVLYNGMIHPIAPFTAKGFLWYQGCANRNRWEQYKRLQPAFVRMLRQCWGNEDMPFYFTQIAPYRYSDPQGREAAFMMWAQAQTLEMIPNSGMAATHDIGEFACIHPAAKKQVGERLAYLALENQYGVKGVDVRTPMPKSYEFKEGAAFVKFNAGRMGVSPLALELEGSFELAGADKVFYPAKAMVQDDRHSIKVWCPEVPEPVAVRYGMRNWSQAQIFNCYGIPVSPFRSDDWD